ncbi:HEAT repeat domain-containing protein [Pseudarthrobacter phenanthrenivorans]|uniref:HEAT repeat domain-containing protein n=1 Tax=Pseudarthrobacter phenanthrenivorans TaxID=361575 RepID=UPI003450CC25
MTKRSDYRAVLESLPPGQWLAYLDAESGLPGPRGNIELAEAFADVADPGLIEACVESPDEYQAMCGAVGLGRLLVEGRQGAAETLRGLAADNRWRVREGVAMALQRLGDADMPALWTLAAEWLGDGPLVQRAVAAGVCEPRLLRTPEDAGRAVDVLDKITAAIAGADPGLRRTEEFRVLRQGLGYCWSVAVAAAPDKGFGYLEKWAVSPDKDVRWILRENLKKARLARADQAACERLAARLEEPGE